MSRLLLYLFLARTVLFDQGTNPFYVPDFDMHMYTCIVILERHPHIKAQVKAQLEQRFDLSKLDAEQAKIVNQ